MPEMDLSHRDVHVLSGAGSFCKPPQAAALLHLAAREVERGGPVQGGRMDGLQTEEASTFGRGAAAAGAWNADTLRDSLKKGVRKLRDALDRIDEAAIDEFLREYAVTSGHLGTRVKEALLMRLAEEKQAGYDTDAESDHVDGAIADHPVVFVPGMARAEWEYDETAEAEPVFFTVDEDGIHLVYEF